ncbi:MAG: TIGR02584 family CRISPR-associated protein [Nitrospinae bacterium]|nr:TIGR02584 family CRISPR-associated protein [Nitrospinota bacterium]
MKSSKYREILIYVAGITPQIITETLYALHHKKPSIHPDEIFIITTITGKAKIEKSLLSEGKLEAFYHEYAIKPVSPNILLISNKRGDSLDDIKTDEDNEDVGNFIAMLIREKTKQKDTRLLCSIAGGRKTMSFYLGAALSLFGRPQDKLYHVLVTPEFESHPDFYWKPKKNTNLIVKDREGKIIKRLNTKKADIYLAELSFIRIGNKFILSGKKGFRELVLEGQKEIDTASAQLPLKISIKERAIKIGENSIEMIPIQLVVYMEFLRRKLKQCAHPRRQYCLDCTECFPLIKGGDFSDKETIDEMAKMYKEVYGRREFKDEEFSERWKKTKVDDILRQNISKINRIIKEHFNDEILSSFYTITPVGKYGGKKYGIKVDKKKIEIEGNI